MSRRVAAFHGSTRIVLALIAGFLAIPLVASAESATIEIHHHHVSPAEASVAKGETVTFVNMVDMFGGHRVVADDSSFSSPALQKDQAWTHTFEEAGTFAYHVEEHPGTKGVIRVE